MAKANFIYIGKNDRRKPTDSFYALKLSKRDKETLFPKWSAEQIKETIVYYPKTDDYKENELFVGGLGWKKFGKTNKVVIPTFSGNVEDWDEYLEKYGKYCLFYSLSGYSLDDMDCCAFNAQREFLSLLQCNGGIVKYQKYVENFKSIQEIQKKVFAEKLSFISETEMKYFVRDNLFTPYFAEWILSIPPYLDTPNDDYKMEVFYRKYRKHEIKLEHSDYDWKKISEIMDKEMEEGKVFPICMSDRMKMLFGEKCHTLYQYILEHFKD